MKTQIEYRISEEIAREVFGKNEGKRLGDLARVVVLDANDRRWSILARLYSTRRGDGFFGWHIRRSYSAAETKSAELHLFRIRANIRPTGEQCGTLYDDSEACPLCGAGRVQMSPLRLRITEAPKTAEIAQTWAGEVIVSRRVVRLLIDAGMTGFSLGPVQRSKKGEEEPFTLSQTESGKRLLLAAETALVKYPSGEFYVWINQLSQDELFRRAIAEHESKKLDGRRKLGGTTSEWYQLLVTSKPIELAPPTVVGKNPLDPDLDGPNRCPVGSAGHVIGLNLLSQATVRTAGDEDHDFLRSVEQIGMRRGLFVPKPVWFISARLRRLFRSNFVRGWTSEAANVI